MKLRLTKYTLGFLLILFPIFGFPGWGGIGGGSASLKEIERKDLLRYLKSPDLNVGLPQIQFYEEGAGTHFVTVEKICHKDHEFITRGSLTNLIKTSRILKSPITENILDENKVSKIPLEQVVQVYKYNSFSGETQNLGQFIEARLYRIPECQ